MEELTFPVNPDRTTLNSKEIELIGLFADIRRESAELKRFTLALSGENGNVSGSEILLSDIKQESDGVNIMSPEEADRLLLEREKTYSEDAEIFRESAPSHSAYLLGYIAKLKQLSGKPFQVELEKSKRLAKHRKEADVQLSDLLPHAQILGIARRQIEKESLPPLEVLAKLTVENKKVVRDIGLVLSESDRERFLSLIPENKRKEITILMDNELSRVLSEKIVEKDEDKDQARSVKHRSGQELRSALNNSEEYELELVQFLSQSLSGLDSDDSKRLLAEIGSTGLAGEKDKVKQKRKILSIALVVGTLIDIDTSKGSNLAMKFLAKRELPDTLFHFFAKRLMQEEYLTRNAERYLADGKSVSFLRRLVAMHPNQFNTVIDTISQIKDYDPAKNQEEVFSAMADLDSLTPIIFDRYRQADAFGKKELAKKIRDLKPKFFRNTPVKDILERKDRDILVEMVYLAYKPVGMNFEKVKGFMNTVEDRTEDLAGYRFPENGYDFTLNVGQRIVLKEGESVDYNRLPGYKRMFSVPYPEEEKAIKEFASLLGRIAKAGTLTEEELGKILSVMNRDEFVVNFTNRYDRIDEQNAYNYLNDLREVFGIYFKDNYKERLYNFLSANPSVEGQLMKILTSPDRQKVLKAKLGKRAEEIDWGNLSDKKEMSRLIAIFLDASILKTSKDAISKNVNKYTTEDGRIGLTTKKGLRAYVSKNVGSFFAKASAGICTSDDIPLFNTENHFHINVVEEDQAVRANIQAYIINVDGKKSLLLRGFNPNTDFLDKIDAASFCEKVIEIAKQFQKNNNLDAVYITEQGSWHSLSNREKVGTYLQKRYHGQKNERSYSFKVATNNTISHIYKV